MSFLHSIAGRFFRQAFSGAESELIRNEDGFPQFPPFFLAAAASLSGCGSSASPNHTAAGGTPSGTAAITVTASAGALTHSAPLTLTIQ